ncbi:MAG: VWA domain-containing protein [Anaerolineales bacterium]|nr:VWA domain-containing protein [Anaerolineales bacterium]
MLPLPTRLLRRLAACRRVGLTVLAAALALGLAGLPAARAQEAGPAIVITGVDSGSFPTVTAYLTASGANGLPLVGLTADNFSVTEDGRAVSPRSLVLTSDTSQQLSLVLAVDVSVNEADLANVKAAAIDFVNSLGPSDQVALVTYFDEVVTAVTFTSDKPQLVGALEGLVADGNGTAFNAAIQQSVSLLAALPEGRKAVLTFTNSGDTTDNLAPEPVLDAARKAQARIYPMSFGPNVNQELMDNWARFSGGQAYALTTSSEIRPNLLTLGVLLRQSYALSFESELVADNAAHRLQITLDDQGATASATSSFTGVPGEVVVEGPGLSNGQTVRGMVFLVADVQAPAAVETVRFQLDDQVLAELTKPPYRFDWDSTLADPGTHTLKIEATDAAGNVGVTQVTVNVVLPPPVVITATPAPTVAVPTGPSPVTVMAQTAARVLAQILGGALILLGLIVAFVLWLRTLRSQRQVQIKTCQVELTNQGNARSRYELRAEDPSNALKFQFALHEAGLATRPDAGGRPALAQPAARGAAPAPAAAGNDKLNPKAAVDKGVAAGQRGLSVMENITAWLSNVSYLMPGTGGRKMRGSISQVRGAQYEAYEGLEMPGRVERVVKAAAPPPVTGSSGTTLGGYAAAPTATMAAGAPPAAAQAQLTGAPTTLAQAGAARPGWSVTPYVEPGQSLVVQLLVSPLRAPRTQHYAFRVLARTAEDDAAQPVVEHGTVALRGVGLGRRVLTVVLFLLTVALLGLLAWYLLLNFGMI